MISPLLFRFWRVRLAWVFGLGAAGLAGQSRALAEPPRRPHAAQQLAKPRATTGHTGGILTVGYQAGRWAVGMPNVAAYALQLNRAVVASGGTVQQALNWPTVFHGAFLRGTYVNDNLAVSLGWSNRHTIAETRYTDRTGQEYRTEYRIRLNEVSIEVGGVLWEGRLRPGVGADIGLFRASTRTAKADESTDWHSIHFDDPNDGLLAPGRLAPTTGLTLFCDVAPLGQRGGGPTLRPYYQFHIMQPDLFGTYATADSNKYQYAATNYGLALSWGFATK